MNRLSSGTSSAKQIGSDMGNIIGYARVSTTEQNPALQLDALIAAGAVRIFTDYCSGASADRPELARCLDYLQPGNVLAVWRIDRLGRSVPHLVSTVATLAARNVQFQSLTEQIDTTTAGGELIFTIFAALAQMERRVLSERTLAGLDAARARGRIGGRPTVMTTERIEAAVKLRAGGMPVTQIAETFGVGRATVRRALQSASRMAGA
jgi:DNA invertase Pin-like site-specific DNA recombinase